MNEKEKAELAETIAEAAATAVADSIEAQFVHFTDELRRKLENELYELKQQLDRAATQAATERALFFNTLLSHITNELKDLKDALQRCKN